MLEICGIGRQRLHLAWVSSAEAQLFADITKQTVSEVKKQGKFDPKAFEIELGAAEMTVNSEDVRWLVGKQISITTKGDVYGRKWDKEKYQDTLYTILEREYQKNLIYLAIQQGESSVRGVSKMTGLDLLNISYLLADLEKTNRVEFSGMSNRIPSFVAL